MNRILNAKQLPKRYFGLHMVEGVAEYKDKTVNGEPFRILVPENTIKNMDESFSGRPVYVHHVDEVNLDEIQEADGYVVKSFYNKLDGKHWAEFMVVSDRGHEAIKMGWKLSNAYLLKETAGGGTSHGVDYTKEVMSGEYEHLAIVPNPRYQESVIMTPDEFKTYNQNKELELTKLANSNQIPKGDHMKFSFFKKTKVDNSADLEQMSVTLPKSLKEVTLTTLVNDADAIELAKKEKQYANGEHIVKLNDDSEMSVNELVEKHNALVAEKSEKEPKKEENVATDKEVEKKAEEIEEHEKKEIAEKKPENEKPEDDKKKENKEEEPKKEEKAKNDDFEKLKNAEKTVAIEQVVDLASDKISRGQSRYGSK